MQDDYFNEEIDAAVRAENNTMKKANEQEKDITLKKVLIEESASSVEAKITKRQMDSILSALDKSKLDIIEITNKLHVHVDNLADEGLILNEIPSKLARQLKEAIPEISKEIKVQCLKDLDQNIKTCYSNLVKLDDIAIAATNKITNLESDRLKRSMILITIVLVVSVLSASASTYFMMQKFPPFVEIKTNSDIQIDNSRVHVFSQKDPIVNKAFEKVLPSKK